MGQNSSRQSVSSSLRDRIKPLRKRGNSDLSATFNMLDVDLPYDQQLNINLATEEELMTLPGITRTTARNIIEYKQTIGAFRKVEDLALVSGVGATRLEQLRPEICVSTRRNRANTSSLTSSLNGSTESLTSSVTSNTRSVKASSFKVINVNKANVFELMAIRGISQELAANIVHCREKKGYFKSLDDLIKVKGISNGNLSLLRHHFTIDMNANAVEYVPQTPQRTPQVLHSKGLHHRTRSAPSKYSSVSDQFDKSELYELLSARCSRPIREEQFSFRRNGKTALRLATWNLQHFLPEKVDNPGVREVICRTILENGFSLIACQELGDKEVLDKICAELTNPCLRKVQSWPGHRGTWECITSEAVGTMHEAMEYNGFLYDTSRGIELIDSGLLSPLSNKENGGCPQRPFWTSFQVDRVNISIVCVHISSSQLSKGRRNSLLDSLKTDDMLKNLDHLQLSKNVIILGDMNLAPTESDFNPLRESNFTHIVPCGTFTNANSRNFGESKFHDNIWISKLIRNFFTGQWGVVRQGLSHIAIPNGWTWGGMVSGHCPVWAEFYVQLNNNDELNPSPLVVNGSIKEESI